MVEYESDWVESAWQAIILKVKKTSLIIGNQFPSMTEKGVYGYTKDYWRWVTGFWPGLLWLLYEDTQYEPFKDIAIQCEEKMDEALYEYTNLHHDVGFMWLLTSVKQYKLYGHRESRQRGLIAASHLASRFNIKGQYLVAWNQNNINEADSRGLSIIDSLMNLPLLYWASTELNDPRLAHIAEAHSETVLKHFIRNDGSVNHMVEFDPYTGEMLKVYSGQGYSESSAWSRGASWALHGMALAYKYTEKKRYLKAAESVADFFISQLPENYIPYWDFRASIDKETPRDTSAAACAACGLLELSKHSNEKGYKYDQVAKAMVKSLYQSYGNWSNDQEGLLRGGTFNYPKGLGINVSLIYGDYYYVEALKRLRENYNP